MSAQNDLEAKQTRRAERIRRKAKSAQRMPFHGVIVRKGAVIGHRYLAVHGLPFCQSVAAVQIEAAAGDKP